MAADQQPQQPSPELNLDERVGVLTATVDQLQAEYAHAAFAITFLLLATAMLAGVALIQHRQLVRLTADA